jgi:alpha-tubulin suppressor-like RCC1 family protein
VVAWGLNSHGQTTVPEGLTGVTAIAAGDFHTVALQSDTTVLAWGDNSYGQTAVPAGLSGVVAVAAGGNCSFALKGDGTLAAWGDTSGQCTVPSGLTGVTAIVAGGAHAVALKNDGTVVAWGDNSSGQITLPADLSGVVAIAAGRTHTVALKRNGTVVAWGDTSYNQTDVPAGLSGISAIAAGYDHSIALRNDGTVTAWGRSDSGQIAIPAGLSGIIAVAGGAGHSVGVKNDGAVVAWGANDFGEAAVPVGLVDLVPIVDGILNYDPVALSATFTPSGPAVSGASYYADLNGVRNQSGAVLVSPVRWGFMAVDTALPAITPLTNDFGNVAVNVTSASKTFTLGNTGTKSLAVGAVTLDGTDAGLFGVTPGSCPNLTPTIAAGGNCTVNVFFTPTTAGVKSANLRVISDATINPELNVPLGGTGVIPLFTLSGTVISSAGTPIDGATVTATGGYTTTTNQSGQYQLVFPAGVVTITVSAFAHQSQTVADLVISGNTVRDFTLALDSTASAVQVAVVDGSGHGWPLYARIGIAGNSAPVYTNPLTGAATLFLYQNSTYALTVNSPGYSAATRDITPASGGSSENFVLTVDQSYCMAPGYPPLSFANLEKNAGGYATTKPAYWSCGTPTNRTPHSGSTACFADLSSGGRMDWDTYLYSPNMDLRANAGSSLTLSWWQMMGISGSNEGLYVDVSKDGGYSWSNVYLAAGWDWSSSKPEPAWTKHSITLDSSYAVSNFKIRFNFWGYSSHASYTYWYIDDVAVQAQNSCPLQPGGLLVGAVHDSITNAGLNNVTISDSANRTAVSLATPEDTKLDDGFYTFFLPAGAHDLTASATGFQPQTINGVTVANNSIATQDFSLNVVPLSVTTPNLAFGIQGSAYTRTVSATGGHPPYTWSIVSGALPDGLTVNSATGTIGGTPTTTGTSGFTVQATDAIGVTASNTYSVSIYSPMSVPPVTLPFAVTGSVYSQTISALGGLPPYTWSISAGALPAGLSFNAGTGVLSGTPTATGTFNFTVKATVANNDSVTRPLSMTVYNPLAISSGNSYYSAGSAYSQTLVATGGKPPYSWDIISGALPAGMTLDSTSGIISGSSTVVGTSRFTLQATDANGTVISKAITLTSYLSVTGIQPANGSTVPADAVVQATFSDPLNPATVTAGNVMLYRNGGVRAVAAGGNHTVVLKTGGTVTAWGYNGYGISTVPAGLAGVTSIAAGEKHTLALKSDGTAVAWGLNDYGQTTVPAGLGGVIAMSAGNNHTLALKSDGTVVAWGDNSYGQSTVPAGLTGVIAVAAGTNYSLALTNDNAVVAWGYNGSGQATPPAGLTGAVAIAAGVSHSVALKSDGTVVSWGSISNGQGTVPAGLTGVIAIAAGSYHTVALKADGTVVAWGRNYEGQTTVPAGLSGVIAVAAGGNHTVVLKSDGTVAAWGYNNYGESGVPAGLSVSGNTVSGTLAYDAPSRTVTFTPSAPLLVDTYHYVKIAGVTSQAGVSLASPVNWSFKTHVLYIQTALPSGTTGAGYNHRLVVSGGSAPFAWSITSGALPAGLALDRDTGIISGTASEAVTTGFTVQVADATSAVFSKALSLTIHPTVTGYNPASGATVLVNTTVQATFSDPLNSATITADSFVLSRTLLMTIAAGMYHSVALKNDGTVVAWGASSYGAYGQEIVPAGLTGVTAIAAGNYHTVALKNNGRVVAWGRGYEGQTEVPAGLSGVVAIAAGDYHTVALRNNGTVVIWGTGGNGGYGQATVPAGLTGVIAIAAGAAHTVALKSDGTVVAWGSNSSGQTSVPAGLTGVTAIAAGAYHTVALKMDGTVVVWGSNSYGQTTVPAGLTGVIAIAAGAAHTVALKIDGSLVAWGFNGGGQTTVPVGLSGIIAIAAGYSHSMALKNDGSVVAWGNNTYGQTTVPAGFSSVGNTISGTLSYDFPSRTVTLTPSGQLLDGVTYYASVLGVTSQTGVPLAIPVRWSFKTYDALMIVTAALPAGVNGAGYDQPLNASGGRAPYSWVITAGALPAGLVLNNDTGIISGTLTAAGIADFTIQVTDANGTSNSTALTITSHPAVTGYLPANGSLVPLNTIVQATFSDPLNPATVNANNVFLFSNVGTRGIAAGFYHNVALKSDRTVVAWGDNNYGQATVPTGLTGVKAIAAGGYHSVALKTDGTVVSWGESGSGQSTVPAGLSGVVAIAAGYYHTVALKSDGTVVAWGRNYEGQTSVPVGLTGVIAIAAGSFHTVALKNDGTVVAWGYSSTVPEGVAGVIAIAAGNGHTVALKSDGTVVAWGYNGNGQATVPPGLSGVTAIAAGSSHTVALKNDGMVVAWGDNNSGQTTLPAGLSGVTAIAAGYNHTVTLKNDGTVFAWGQYSGQSTIPAAVSPSAKAVSGTVTYDPASLTATFTPAAPLSNGVTYYATIAGVTSEAGIPLAAPLNWSFMALDSDYPLNITFAGTGTGRVDLDSGGSCTSNCSQTFTQASVTLTAVPATDMIFGGWKGCDSVSGNRCTVSPTGTRNVIATFVVPGEPVMLAVDKVGSGSGSVISSPSGINLASSWYGTAQFPAGSIVTLTATSDSGSTFSGWRGACSGLGNCTVTINAETMVSAVFTTTAMGNPGPVKMDNQFFQLFQDAYNGLLDGSTATISANSLNIFENLVFNRNVAVTLKGGYDGSFGTNSGQTVIRGTLTITSGSVTMENIIIQ